VFQISPDALDFAIEHIDTRGDTDILPVPFEYQAIRHTWDDIKRYLVGQDLDAWAVRPHRRCLAPKSALGLRIATQLDPLDALLLTALVYEVGGDLESARLAPSDKVVHSYRFSPNLQGQIFDPHWNFDTFRIRSLELAGEETCTHVVITDIADFFPRIYSHPLENALSISTDRDHARVIDKFLRELNMGLSYGLPVGPPALGYSRTS